MALTFFLQGLGMARKPDPDSTDTEFMKIPALPDDADLDSLRRIGHFSARDPQGLAAGDYFITNYVSNIGGNRRTIQIAENAQTGAQQYRAKATSGWTSWTDRAGGGGSGSTNLGSSAGANSVTITSDTGTDATISAATDTQAGVLTAALKTKLDGIENNATADQTGSEIVAAINAELGGSTWQTGGGSGTTNLGYTQDASSVTITSDTGSDAVIPAAGTDAAGMMSAADKTALDALAAVIGNIPDSPSRIFNVLDYGALPDGGSAAAATNRAAFEAAIVAAAAAGGGQIYAPRGTYYINYGGAASVGGVRLRSNMHLVGDGMGITTIKAADIGNNDMAGLVRTQSGIENSNIVIRDLTIDANKAEQTGWANIICFFAGVTPDNRVLMDRDIWCINVECKNGKNGTTGSSNLTRGYGFDPHEVVDRFVAVNCIAHDCERDGFVLDGVLNFQLIGCKSWNSGRHNFNFITTTFNGEVVGCHAWNPGLLGTGNNYTVQSNSSHITFVGCRSRDSLENGFRIRCGDVVTETFIKLVGCHIENSRKNGLQLTGASYNTVEGCTFQDNGYDTLNTYFDVALDEDDGDFGAVRGAAYNLIRNNLAIRTLGVGVAGAKSAYRESDTASVLPHDNVFEWNEAYGNYSQAKYYNVLPTTTIVDRGYLDFYNVKDHGAKGDGTTDDGPAIRALIDLVELRGGGTLFFPPGTFMIGGTGTASQGGLALPDKVHILGSGIGVTIIQAIDPGATAMTGVVRTKSGGTSVGTRVEGVTISGPAAATVDIPVVYIGATDSNVTLRRVRVTGGKNGAGNGGYGIRLDGAGVTNVTIEDCVVESNARDNIYVNGASKIRVFKTNVASGGRHGINVDGGSSFVTVVGCRVESSASNNLIVQGESYSVDVLSSTFETSTEDNLRIRRGTTVTETKVHIENCNIMTAGRDGISIASASKNRVTNCRFVDNGQSANDTYFDVSFELDATNATSSAQNFVSSCSMYATATNKTRYAIFEASGATDDNRYVGNFGSGHTDGYQSITGAASKVIDYTVTTVTPGGTTGQVQYNNAGAFEGTDRITIGTFGGNPYPDFRHGLLLDNATGTPSDDSRVYLSGSRLSAGKLGLLAKGDGHTPYAWLQDAIWGKNVFMANVRNHGTTTMDFHGIQMAVGTGAAFTTTGPSARAIGDGATRAGTVRRVGFSGSASAGNGLAYLPNSTNYLIRGSSNIGGFMFATTFALTTVSAQSRAFFGLAAIAGAATVPWIGSGAVNTGVDIAGVGWDAGDTELSFYTNDNVGTATKSSFIGSSIGTIAAGKVFRLVIACGPSSQHLTIWLHNITDNLGISNTFTTDLPRNNVFLAPLYTMYNNTDAVAMAFDLASIYGEQSTGY